MPRQSASCVRDPAEKHDPARAAAPGVPGAPIDDTMAAQLQTVFSRMQSPLVLRLHLNGGDVSAELRAYMDALAAQTDLLSVDEAGRHR